MTSSTRNQVFVDSRGPRFGATITSVLLLINLFLALISPADISSFTVAERLSQPATVMLLVLFALFVYGAARGVQHHPYGIFFAKVVKPRLQRTAEPEDAAAPTFAQAIGALVTGVGLVLYLLGVALALPLAIAAAFVAAFLNAAFGYCLGCQMYLLLRRAGVIRRA